MQTGYVFNIAPGLFGILSYKPRTEVRVRVLDRVDTTTEEAVAYLNKRFAGHFRPADADQRKWAKTIIKSQDILLVLTDDHIG